MTPRRALATAAVTASLSAGMSRASSLTSTSVRRRRYLRLDRTRITVSVERADQRGHSGPADDELRRQLALRGSIAVAVAAVEVRADDRVVGRHGHLVRALARPWPSPAITPRDLKFAGAADKSHQRLQAQHQGHWRQRNGRDGRQREQCQASD